MPKCKECGREIRDDDSALITEEWLRSVGFKCRAVGHGDCFDPPNEIRWNLELDQFGALPCARYGDDPLPFRNHCKTRGDVRLLCRALHVPLKEGDA